MRSWFARLVLVSTSATAFGCAEDFVCTVDYDCPGSEFCNTQTGSCEPFVCDVDDDCPNPTDRCDQNRCVAATTSG